MIREHQRRRIENLRKPRTAMANAFFEALRKWVARHADDDNAPIVIPTGTVTSHELAQVVCALIAIQKSPANGRAG
jgi:hypothetical protein